MVTFLLPEFRLHFLPTDIEKGTEKRQNAVANLVLDLCNAFRDLSGGKQ